MLIIVTYDVSTETPQGRKRLRQVAKTCTRWGQRVQKSVFECRVDAMQYESLERALLAIMDPVEDSIRLYRLTEPVDLHVKEYGNVRAINFDEDPLIC
jgi:CRISPR-associated protein Cas2